MRKPPAIITPAAPKTPPKTAPKTTSKRVPKVERGLLAPNSGGIGKAASAPKAPVKTTPVKTLPAKTAKTIPVKAAPSKPATVRVVAETPAAYFAGVGGQAWRLTSRHAIAYVRDAALAGELLATEPRGLAKAAMAVYYDRKGKAFAWQFRFDTARWAEVVGRLG